MHDCTPPPTATHTLTPLPNGMVCWIFRFDVVDIIMCNVCPLLSLSLSLESIISLHSLASIPNIHINSLHTLALSEAAYDVYGGQWYQYRSRPVAEGCKSPFCDTTTPGSQFHKLILISIHINIICRLT